MPSTTHKAYARTALLGNPSDGYGGRTISLILKNYWAAVSLEESRFVEVHPTADDRVRFRSVRDLASNVRIRGYYGGVRLIQAAIKRFSDYCGLEGLPLDGPNFSVRYNTNIPRQVGLAGSSAIILATIRALSAHYGVHIDQRVLPSLVLSVERDELGIQAGLQDRVVQVYEGLVYMDFSTEHRQSMAGLDLFLYEPLETSALPNLYVSYHNRLGEPTEVVHNDLRRRFIDGDVDVRRGMAELAEVALEGRSAIMRRDHAYLRELINRNFDIRSRFHRMPVWQATMVEVARSCGASANLTGSGGAIVGIYEDEAMFARLASELSRAGATTIRPRY